MSDYDFTDGSNWEEEDNQLNELQSGDDDWDDDDDDWDIDNN